MTATGGATNGTKASIWHRLYHGETSFNFVGNAKRWFLISGAVILVGLLSLGLRGLNFGIDFRGGTAWEVPAKGVSERKVRDALRPVGLQEARIQILGGENVRVQADTEGGTREERQARQAEVTKALAQVAGVPDTQVSVNEVGASWGKDITSKALRALVAFLLAITLFITFRFEFKMALAALAALFHDILVTVGVYSLSGFEVTPATVVAFLTILGYSLYDTIVVFDKVEENTRGLAATGRMTYSDTVNLSMNQVLMRSLNTSLVAVLPIFSVLFVGAFLLGATTLQDFGLALFIGLLTGAYSSIYIASPLLAILKEREPRYASLRQRAASRGGGGPPLTPAAAAAAAGTPARTVTPAASSRGGSGDGAPAGSGDGAREGDTARAGDGAATRPSSASGPAKKPAASRPAGNRPPPRPRKKGKRR